MSLRQRRQHAACRRPGQGTRHSGISKSQVSRLCQALDVSVEQFGTHKLDGIYANVQLDATFVKVRQEHRVVNMPSVMAAGVKLVTGDAHEGLKAAIAAVLQGASWKRCRTHFMRNAMAVVPWLGIFGNERSIIRLVGGALAEQKRRVGDRSPLFLSRVAGEAHGDGIESLTYRARLRQDRSSRFDQGVWTPTRPRCSARRPCCCGSARLYEG